MANTMGIKTDIEPYVRGWLSKQFNKHSFAEFLVKLPAGKTYKADAVSDDGLIVAAILCNRPRTRTGRENTGGVRKALNDIEYLKQLPDNVKKVMVFTNCEFCNLIRRRAKLNIESINFLICTLPIDKENILNNILDQASHEQRAAE